MIRVAVLEDGEEVAVNDYPRDIVLIGAEQGADLRVESEQIEPHHAELWALEGRCYVRPLGEHSLIVNGQLVAARAEIEDEAVISLGDVSLRVFANPQGLCSPTTTRKRSRTAVMLRLKRGVIDFSQAERSQELMEQARRLLVEARATPAAFEELKTQGVEHARALIAKERQRSLAQKYFPQAAHGPQEDEASWTKLGVLAVLTAVLVGLAL